MALFPHVAPNNGKDSTIELKAVERSVFRKRRALWGGFIAVVVPLFVLLALQSWWLADLEHKSAIARKATLRNFIDVVSKEVHGHYLKISERALNLPSEVFEPDKIQKIGSYFKKKKIDGAQRRFVVSFRDRGKVYFYNPETHAMERPDFTPETLAVWAAIAPWEVLLKKHAKIETLSFSVDERDTDHRIILYPITDEKSKIVGLAGMILDQRFFEETLLPKATQSILPKFPDSKDLWVVVRDQNGRQILPAGPKLDLYDDVVRRSFDFVFADWTIALQGAFAEPDSWGKTNFAYNMSLSIALAVVLLAGISIALRTAAREMKLSTMKNDFVSNVSHELRTPLASIRVFGEFMRLGRVVDQGKVREYGEYIETESRRLTQLINNILDFSRIESGQVAYRFGEADLEDVLTETLGTFAVRLRNSGFEIEYESNVESLPQMVLDENAISRAIANLVDNAVKYSNGDRRIGIVTDIKDDHVVIAVSDHGIGIPRDELNRIFERFHRVSTGLVHDVKGSGLGLTLVQHIVKAHGGKVTVESEPGVGSTFNVHLPLVSPHETEKDDDS